MTAELIVSLISAGVTALGVFIPNYLLHRKSREDAHASYQLIEYKIENLTKEQKKYNNLQERLATVETTSRILDERQKVANHRIDDLERGVHNGRGQVNN